MRKLLSINDLGILPLKDREAVTDKWLLTRLDTILPHIMRKHGADMWIIAAREYNEDPIFETFFPSAIDSSRRLTIVVFYQKNSSEMERLVLHSNPKFEPFYQRVLDVQNENQWDCLMRIIRERNPETIALNYSDLHAVSDGLTHSLYQKVKSIIDRFSTLRVFSAEKMVVEWLETRIPDELAMYPKIVETARQIAAEAFSNAIIPGVTRSGEVVDWIRQRVLDLGIRTSFYPTIDVQRRGGARDRSDNTLILPGDIVHLDFGIHYLGLATDTQLLAYACEGEKEVPAGLKAAMDTANRLEDIIAENFVVKRSGNEVFHASIKIAEQEGINAMIYSHPLGFHCHGAGPIIGLFDLQGSVPVRGEYLLKNDTCYAMEFNIRQYIPEWGQDVTLFMEESISFTDHKVTFLTKRQKEFYLIHKLC